MLCKILAVIMVVALVACEENIDESSRYTFSGDTVASYLEKNEETFSSFIEVAKRGGRFSVLAAYGQYTCYYYDRVFGKGRSLDTY